jgi:hypothetical protein
MKMKQLLFASVASLVVGTMGAMAQNPPGAAQQERGVREDAGRPTVVVPPPRVVVPPRSEREEIVVPAPVERGTVGQSRRGPLVDDPPGAEFQDRGNNEDAGKPGDGDPIVIPPR